MIQLVIRLKLTYFASFGGRTLPLVGYDHAISMSNSLKEILQDGIEASNLV